MGADRATSYRIATENLPISIATAHCCKAEVTADDVAEAALVSRRTRSAKSTGAMLPVDGE